MSTDSAMRIAQLFAATISGYHRYNGAFVKVAATVGDNGMITTTITDVDFKKPDSTVRVIWHPTAPVPVTDVDAAGEPSTAGAMGQTDGTAA